jgi:hypothetical protein
VVRHATRMSFEAKYSLVGLIALVVLLLASGLI